MAGATRIFARLENVQSTLVAPQRESLRQDLEAVRTYAQSLRQTKDSRPYAVFGRARRDEFWEERLEKAPPAVVAAAELSARTLGFLLVVALLALLGLPHLAFCALRGNGFGGVDATAHGHAE